MTNDGTASGLDQQFAGLRVNNNSDNNSNGEAPVRKAYVPPHLRGRPGSGTLSLQEDPRFSRNGTPPHANGRTDSPRGFGDRNQSPRGSPRPGAGGGYVTHCPKGRGLCRGAPLFLSF
ncbi:MAG: hypothetical protein BJ554DRAFT_7689 [Olpidium bornovanus]|uniref:Uncharacterized protein n=1 Tax=Olpidium bornovanus TaxID=278681 RepID=A0A8H8DJ94_9FUNG|nr:MAG: hypothetical protein BJ554DRAFT_7689 [Olpidium bornovanus]